VVSAAALTYLGIGARVLQDCSRRLPGDVMALCSGSDAMPAPGEAEPREDAGCCSKASSLARNQGSSSNPSAAAGLVSFPSADAKLRCRWAVLQKWL